jgi:hypothetical protein
MKKTLLVLGMAAAVSVGTVSLYAASQPDIRLDVGPLPVTEQQLRDRLSAAGFNNIRLTPRITFEALAMKNGQTIKLAINADSGVVTRMSEDDDDDD